MAEPTETKASLLVDREAGERYKYVIEVGRKMFAGTTLVDPEKEIRQSDIELIAEFHKVVSPTNPRAPWRLTSQQGKSLEKGDIVDPSFFGDWEAPGGALEHINLASSSATIVVRELQKT